VSRKRGSKIWRKKARLSGRSDPKSKKVIAQQFPTFAGVMQAPGAKDKDMRGGFEHGRWQLSYYDEV